MKPMLRRSKSDGDTVSRTARNPTRSIYLDGRRSNVRLEGIMWEALSEIARYQAISRQELIRQVAATLGEGDNLSSAIRVYIVQFYRAGARGRQS
jgi:predicted DNA-binding ribbon-helix-helix protein